MVDGAASEWIPIISYVSQGNMMGPLPYFVLYTSEMFELVESRLFAYADDSTVQSILAVVRKRADRPAVAAYLKQGLG